jgi:glycosyltransferase involved in cell wall biosynthesis
VDQPLSALRETDAMIVAIDTNCILPGQVGGIENYTLGLIEALKLRGSPASKLVLLTRPENQELFSRFVDSNTRAVLLDRPTYRGNVITNWAEFIEQHPVDGPRKLAEFQNQKANALHEHRADLLHCPGNTINPISLRIPIVLNLHDLQHRHFPEYFSKEELANREKWWVASALRADALIAASNYVRDDLHRQLHLCREKIFVTPDVFESAFFQPPGEELLQSLRERLHLPDTFFIYPAACWPHKNHERLIRAFLAANLPGAQLVLTGGAQESLSQFASQANIRLLGRVETTDLVGLYHLATAMVFPSQHESWSIPIMEAMACGCPVACSNVTSLPEQIGDAGLLFEPDDEPQMTSVIKRLATDADLREVLSSRGRCRVKKWGHCLFLKTITAAYGFATGAFYARKAA